MLLLVFAAVAVSAAVVLIDDAAAASPPSAPGHDHSAHVHETVCVPLSAAPGLCTHGPDAAPKGVGRDGNPSIAKIQRRIAARSYDTAGVVGDGDATYGAAALTSPAVCGTSGARVQAVYMHHSGRNRYDKLLPTIRRLALVADDYVNRSAGQVGTGLRIRWATTSSCKISVKRVVVGTAARNDFNVTIRALRKAGMTSSSRKYIAWLDTADGLCGIGSSQPDDRASQLNFNNQTTGYAQINRRCWGGGAEMHELFHTLGAVQASAPRSTAYGHCRDEQDAMCYQDGPGTKLISPQPCPNAFQWQLDCNKNDYFNPRPKAGTYLATHWNTAKSKWLEPDDPPPTAPTISLPAKDQRVAGLKWSLAASSKSRNGTPLTYRWGVRGYTSTAPPCRFSDRNDRTPQFWCDATYFPIPVRISVTVTDGKGMTNATERHVEFAVAVRATTISVESPTTIAAGTAAGPQAATFKATVRHKATGRPVIGLPVAIYVYNPATTFSRTKSASTNHAGVVTFATDINQRVNYQAQAQGFRYSINGVTGGWNGSTTSQRLIEWRPVFDVPTLSGATLSARLTPTEALGSFYDYVDVERKDPGATEWVTHENYVARAASGAYEYAVDTFGTPAPGTEFRFRKTAWYVGRFGQAISAPVTVP